MNIRVKVNKILGQEGKVRAIVSVTLDDAFTIHGIKVIQTEKGRFLAMPNQSWKPKDGETRYQDIFHPITSEARRQLEQAVYEEFGVKQVQTESESHAQSMSM